MTEHDGTASSPADRLEQIASRPARLIPMICQMILGVVLLITLVLKGYMLVLTDHQCSADADSLGNLIRCTSTLAIMAHVLALSAGFELVRGLFREGLDRIIAPVMLGLAAALLGLLAGLQDGPGWQGALLMVALVASIGAIAWVGRTWIGR